MGLLVAWPDKMIEMDASSRLVHPSRQGLHGPSIRGHRMKERPEEISTVRLCWILPDVENSTICNLSPMRTELSAAIKKLRLSVRSGW